MQEQYPPLVAIFGPTASGKSALALTLSEQLGGEIVTADSRQVYRYMDIGTDKPSPVELSRLPHHLIDIVNPDEPYTLALYQEQAYTTIDDILHRGSLPVLAGGTPLYVNALIEGWVIPRVEPDMEYRARLEREATESGPAPLYARLWDLDPAAALKILPTNTRRIIRALEVIEATGHPISAQQSRTAPPYTITAVLLTCERAELFRRIDERVDRMIERGLVEEVRGLHDMGYAFDLPSMSGLGYRQIGAYLQGLATLAEAVQRIKWDTHAFVRHQENWFRRVTNALTFEVTTGTPTAEIVEAVRSVLSFAPGSHGGV
jgi:tRNA dimethylallyltransferase